MFEAYMFIHLYDYFELYHLLVLGSSVFHKTLIESLKVYRLEASAIKVVESYPYRLEGSVSMFLDDITLFSRNNSAKLASTAADLLFSVAFHWFIENKLSLQRNTQRCCEAKTQHITFSLCDDPLRSDPVLTKLCCGTPT
ncbi:hypothetical protein J6590_087190 [Homalodisca vitripennis]|nr:hypothetical protein J6590_087190 [Homalodisca vitripennis]